MSVSYRNKRVRQDNPWTIRFNTDPHTEGLDLTGATYKVRYKKPSAMAFAEATPTREGTTSWVSYRFPSMDEVGEWQIYLSVKFQGDSNWTDSSPLITQLVEASY